jgi:transmembrane sensor
VETINELAARWAVRADAGNLSPDEQRELDSWLAADSRHLGAYVRARAQWADLDRLVALHGPRRGTTNSNPDTTPALSRRRLLATALAGVGVLGGGACWTILRDDRERYSSGIGEVRRIALADGSTLLMNTNSEVTVRLTKERRDVRLVRGEALFEVAPDKSRPFIVRANDTAVRAVGTVFAVRLENARVDVTVTEGVVEVADLRTRSGFGQGPPADTGAGVKRLAAHQRAIVAPARPPDVEPVVPAEADRRLAWREGMVSFDGEMLQTAVLEINRHNRRQIVVDDASLASMPVVGVFRATDLDGFAAAAAAALNARATRDGDIIRLQHGPPRN